MGAPPSLNLLREIFSLISILTVSPLASPLLLVITAFAVAYTLILYARSQQGQFSFSKLNNSSFSLREARLTSSHVFTVFALRLVVSLIF